MQLCLREYWIYPLLSTGITYLIMRTCSRRLAPWLIFAVCLLFLCATHLFRMLRGYPFDPSGVQMILTIKLTSLSFNLLDARLSHEKSNLPASILAERKARSIQKIPSPLEYFGYMFFFGGILTGPAFEFMEYVTSVDRSKYLHYTHPKKQAGNQSPDKPFVPSPIYASLRILGLSLVFLAIYVGLSSIYTFDFFTSEEFTQETNFVTQLVHVFLICFMEKSKYYFIWLIAEGGCVMCSFGFEGYKPNGSSRWHGLNNIDLMGMEFAQSIREVSVSWNRLTAVWLRRYVYERVSRPYNLYFTYIVSSFWHGFYPGYYLFFLTVGVAQEITRMIRSKVRPYFVQDDGKTPKKRKMIYDFLGFLLTYSFVSYAVIPFMVLKASDTLIAWKALKYYGHAMIAFGLIFALIVPRKKTLKKKE